MHPIAAATCLVTVAMLLAWPTETSAESDDSWIPKIRRDHPRLFINADLWPEVKARALGEAKPYYDNMKKRVDGYPAEPEGSSGGTVVQKEQRIGGRVVTMPEAAPAKEWGPQALETAFVYRMTGDRQHLDKARKMLEVSLEVYRKCYEERRAVNWYSTTRVCALTAYDWICSDLTDDQRRAIIVPLLQHVDDVQPGPGKPAVHRRNGGTSATDGFYGVANLVWFAGVAAHGDGYCDELALRFLKKGHEYNQTLFEYRKACAGDDGGLASATVGYALGAYPWSQFNFLYTWRSATGENLAPQWEHLAYYPIWILWNWIPMASGEPLEFGSGDTPHYTNALPAWSLYEHMSQLISLYGESHPECMAVAEYIRQRVPTKAFTGTWPLYPFLASTPKNPPPAFEPAKAKLHARHFESLGQIFMRSGWGPADTGCLFTCGSRVPSHKHYDENNFVIYRKGFLALDSGTRGIEKDFSLRHYYAQTVAHNCVLIHLPDEPFASYWGEIYDGPEAKTNYGGMNKAIGATVKAFETNEHFTYAAGDATACYSDRKCKLALRQFVHVLPDVFVICDRVTSTDLDYRKQWLLHTQNEPVIDGPQFRADEGDGRLFCRTLLPKDATLTKVGGPGKEFWANGKNWELNEEVLKRDAQQREKTGKGMLWGHWRVEVSPGAARTEDVFLHVIQVGDQSLPEMVATEAIEEAGQVGVRFAYAGRRIEVRFGTTGEPSGRVRIAQEGNPLVDQELSREVQRQAGLGER
jgi:heparin/heparan-sulfate lyase